MEHEFSPQDAKRPPLRTFEVCTKHENANGHFEYVHHVVEAHLVFNNIDRGETLVFRRYYDDSVRTEKVAEFPSFEYYKEIKK